MIDLKILTESIILNSKLMDKPNIKNQLAKEVS